jgi:hypothetical protein
MAVSKGLCISSRMAIGSERAAGTSRMRAVQARRGKVIGFQQSCLAGLCDFCAFFRLIRIVPMSRLLAVLRGPSPFDPKQNIAAKTGRVFTTHKEI